MATVMTVTGLPPGIGRIDESVLARAVDELARRDEDLAAVVERYGPPPLWAREPGFETLARLILEQQVSLDSGRAAHARLVAVVRSVNPRSVLEAGAAGLRAAGLTRQKTRYLLGLADAIASGGLALERLEGMSDASARNALLAITGVGPWTAECYLLFGLRRPDAWPSGDVALAASVRDVKRLAGHLDRIELDRISDAWRPWRGVAARLLWHAYLSKRGRVVGAAEGE
jgi:DNA-3-methyladenine glycosylase II